MTPPTDTHERTRGDGRPAAPSPKAGRDASRRAWIRAPAATAPSWTEFPAVCRVKSRRRRDAELLRRRDAELRRRGAAETPVAVVFALLCVSSTTRRPTKTLIISSQWQLGSRRVIATLASDAGRKAAGGDRNDAALDGKLIGAAGWAIYTHQHPTCYLLWRPFCPAGHASRRPVQPIYTRMRQLGDHERDRPASAAPEKAAETAQLPVHF